MSCSSAATLPAAEQLQGHRKAEADARILPLFLPRHATSMPQNDGSKRRHPSRWRAINGRVMSLARKSAGFVPISPELVPQTLFARRKFWAERFGIAPVLPTTRAEMDALGWDSCDVILVTGDAYVDHPSFGMALVGRLLEAQGFRVGIIAQPDWRERRGRSARSAARPSSGASPPATWTRWSTATPPTGGSARRRLHAGRRGRAAPRSRGDRLRAALPRGLRRRAARDRRHRGEPAPHRALRLLVGQGPALDPARRQGRPAGLRQRRARDRRDRAPAGRRRAARRASRDLRGTAFSRPAGRGRAEGWTEIDSTTVDAPGPVEPLLDPYAMSRPASRDGPGAACAPAAARRDARRLRAARQPRRAADRARTVDPHADLRAGRGAIRCSTRTPRASCTSSPTRATRARWCSATATATSGSTRRRCRCRPPRWTASTSCRTRARPHPALRRREDPGLRDDPLLGDDHARLLRRLHLLLDHRARGPHHPEPLRGVDPARDRGRPRRRPGFTGVISDLGGPTANMYRLACKSPEIEAACRLPSCVYPGICPNLSTDHAPLIQLYRKARAMPGHQEGPDRVGRALRPGGASPEYVRELAHAPRRRLPEDRARAHRGRPAVEDDEAGHRQLRQVQAAVRRSDRRRPARSST